MDFEQEQASLDDERLSSAVNILQLSSSPPHNDDIIRTTTRPTILRSRRAPAGNIMPVLSTSPSSVPLDNSVLSLSSSNSSVSTLASSNDTPSQSICSPPSPPPKLSIGKERKTPAIPIIKEPADHSQTDSLSLSPPSSPQLDICDFECALCFQIYLQPVTTPCGHVFCKQCLFRAFKHSPACPLCRHKIDSSVNQKYSVNIVLMNVIEKYFPKEHKERASEEEDTQKNEQPLKDNEENTNNRPNSPSNWGCILPSLRSTCTVLLSCGGF